MELENQFKYLVGGYYGVSLMDNYPLKEYMLKEIEEYIINNIMLNNTFISIKSINNKQIIAVK